MGEDLNGPLHHSERDRVRALLLLLVSRGWRGSRAFHSPFWGDPCHPWNPWFLSTSQAVQKPRVGSLSAGKHVAAHTASTRAIPGSAPHKQPRLLWRRCALPPP